MGNAMLRTTPPKKKTRRLPCLGVLALTKPHDMDSEHPGHRTCKKCLAAQKDVASLRECTTVKWE